MGDKINPLYIKEIPGLLFRTEIPDTIDLFF